jgi:hypothetical protein
MHLHRQQFNIIDVQGFHLFSVLLIAGMPHCPASSQSGMKKVPVPQPVWYRNKGAQSGIGMVRYRTEILFSPNF